jgi:hypothetical protein
MDLLVTAHHLVVDRVLEVESLGNVEAKVVVSVEGIVATAVLVGLVEAVPVVLEGDAHLVAIVKCTTRLVRAVVMRAKCLSSQMEASLSTAAIVSKKMIPPHVPTIVLPLGVTVAEIVLAENAHTTALTAVTHAMAAFQKNACSRQNVRSATANVRSLSDQTEKSQFTAALVLASQK